MIPDRELERSVRDWLEGEWEHLPERYLDAALDEISTTRQSRRIPLPWSVLDLPPRLRYGLLVAAILTAAVLGAYVIGTHQPMPARSSQQLIMYTAEGNVFTIQADGFGSRQLTFGGQPDGSMDMPVWSPNGRLIAFWRGRGDKISPLTLMVMDSDGSDQRSLVDGVINSYDIAWSPDSRHIAYREEVAQTSEGMGTAIRIVGLDGSAPRTLVKVGDDPRWSPDGQTIAYLGAIGSYLISADGSADRVLWPGGGLPVWSPDGRRLAFEVGSCCPPRTPAVWLIDRDGTNAHVVVQGPDSYSLLGWAPDGASINYSALLVGTGFYTNVPADVRYFNANADGSGSHELIEPPAAGEPSPDGTRLLIIAATGIEIVDPSGVAKPITIAIGGLSDATWQPALK